MWDSRFPAGRSLEERMGWALLPLVIAAGSRVDLRAKHSTHPTIPCPAKNKQNAEDGPELWACARLDLGGRKCPSQDVEGGVGKGHNCQMDGN